MEYNPIIPAKKSYKHNIGFESALVVEAVKAAAAAIYYNIVIVVEAS